MNRSRLLKSIASIKVRSFSSTNLAQEVVIIGGGITGSSAAYFLASTARALNKPINITVVERDPSYKEAATTLSAASIRHQFSHPTNVAISMFGTQFLRDVNTHLGIEGDTDLIDLNFREQGYLFLATSQEGEDVLKHNHQIQIQEHADVELLTPDQLSSTFPWLNTDDVQLGSYGRSGEGFFDPYTLLMAFKRKARSLGVTYLDDEVSGLEANRAQDQIVRVHTKAGKSLDTTHIINSSGCRTQEIYGMFTKACGLEKEREIFPVLPKRRCVFVFDHQPDPNSPSSPSNPSNPEGVVSLDQSPLLIDPLTGTYFRPEGHLFISGVAPTDREDETVSVDDFDVDYSIWDEIVWPALAHRVPAFERIKMTNAWAGQYDVNTFDQNAIIGPHNHVKNFFLCNGFSGHGLQQAPAVGRGLSELILFGQYQTLDLSRFGYHRLEHLANEPHVELNVV